MVAATTVSVPGVIIALFRHAPGSLQGLFEPPLNFQAAGLSTGYRFFFQTFGICVMIFVSTGNKSTSDVAPCTMNFALKHQRATSKARHHAEILFPGTLLCRGVPINLGHIAYHGTYN